MVELYTAWIELIELTQPEGNNPKVHSAWLRLLSRVLLEIKAETLSQHARMLEHEDPAFLSCFDGAESLAVGWLNRKADSMKGELKRGF